MMLKVSQVKIGSDVEDRKTNNEVQEEKEVTELKQS